MRSQGTHKIRQYTISTLSWTKTVQRQHTCSLYNLKNCTKLERIVRTYKENLYIAQNLRTHQQNSNHFLYLPCEYRPLLRRYWQSLWPKRLRRLILPSSLPASVESSLLLFMLGGNFICSMNWGTALLWNSWDGEGDNWRDSGKPIWNANPCFLG